jgi:hypothetical protein
VAGLNTGGQRFAGDDGAADPRVAAVLAAYESGEGSERAVLTALAGSRLLVPLVERPAEAAEAPDTSKTGDTSETAEACGAADAHVHGCDHRAARELAFPMLIGRDGRPALLAFTSLAALVSWRPDTRPVPTPSAVVWETAVADSCAVVIDVAGPVPVAVDGARLAALAAGQPPPDPWDDPDIRADVAAALAQSPALAEGPVLAGAAAPGEPAIVGAELAAGPDGADLAVRLLISSGGVTGPGLQTAAQRAVQLAAEAIVARLASRLRRGIQFSAALAPAPAPDQAPVRPRG